MKALKITNPLWLGTMGQHIADFVKKAKVDGIYYEGFYSHIANTVQNGGDFAEFWVVFEKNEPIACAHWFVRPLPYSGTVFCDMVYSWTNNKEATGLLAEKAVDFSRKRRCPIMSAQAINKKVFDRLVKVFKEKGVEFNRTKHIFVTGREVKGDE